MAGHPRASKKKEESPLLKEKCGRLFDAMPDLIYVVDGQHRFLQMNRAMAGRLGMSAEEAIGKECYRIVHGTDAPPDFCPHIKLLSEGREQSAEIYVEKLKGYYHLTASPLFEEAGRIAGAVNMARAILRPVWGDKSLRKSISGQSIDRRKTDLVVAAIGDPLCIFDMDFRVQFQNRKSIELMGSHIGEKCFRANGCGSRICEDCPMALSFSDGQPHTSVKSFRIGNETMFMEVTASCIRNSAGEVTGGVEVMRDITARLDTEEKLRSALGEKDLLLRESHHRMKNNLMIVSSLIKLQAALIKDAGAEDLMKEVQNRIRSMSIIHEMLHSAENPDVILLSEYIESLVRQLFKSYRTDTSRVRLEVDASPIELGVDTLIPCGLIINELVSNALKYAFPGDMPGVLKIVAKADKSGAISLGVKDTGVGFPPEIDIHEATSTGLNLVNSLVKQLGGKIELIRNKGSEFRINCRKVEKSARISVSPFGEKPPNV